MGANLDLLDLRALEHDRRFLIRTVLRSIVWIALIVILYFTIPLDNLNSAATVWHLALSVICLILILAWQIRSIMRSSTPAIRAFEGLALSVPLFVFMIATTYLLLSQSIEGSFSEPLTRIDALYFTVTVFSTVGFGDITPQSQIARIVVTTHIVVNMLLVGIGIRVVVNAIAVGNERRRGRN